MDRDREDRRCEDRDTGARPAPGPGRTVTCAMCPATAGSPPLTWSCAVENGHRVYLCDACARSNVRDIEARLDPERG